MRDRYPELEPYDRGMLDVGDGNLVYWEASGNPDGKPAVVLHGGPGSGTSPGQRRLFDPEAYRIVLFDQRGCGRSRPHAELVHNTSQELVADMELIRARLGIGKWLVFGGSWGSTLALLYAETHPERVSGLVLRGIFLATESELAWFYRGGIGHIFPDHFAEFVAPIPASERGDLVLA